MNNKTLFEDLVSEIEDKSRSVQSPVYDILTYPADFTLEVLVQKWKNGDITMAPGQRRYVWNQIKASKLVDSFLIGLPVPPVFFYQERGTNKLMVVDGQQRLQSIVYFFSGKFGSQSDSPIFNLVGLSEKSRFNNETFHHLKEEDQENYNKLNNSVMRSFVVKQLDPQDDTSIFEMFERLNTGGVSLTPQEVRNAVFQGSLTTKIRELNGFAPWRKLIGSVADKRMRDSELILRFLALRWGPKYTTPMKKFLNDFMETHKDAEPAELELWSSVFQKSVMAVISVLGEKPFHLRRGLNAAVYDSVFTAFSKHLDLFEKPATAKFKRHIASRFKALTARDKSYEEWTLSHTTDQDVVPNRIDRAEETLFGS